MTAIGEKFSRVLSQTGGGDDYDSAMRSAERQAAERCQSGSAILKKVYDTEIFEQDSYDGRELNFFEALVVPSYTRVVTTIDFECVVE